MKATINNKGDHHVPQSIIATFICLCSAGTLTARRSKPTLKLLMIDRWELQQTTKPNSPTV